MCRFCPISTDIWLSMCAFWSNIAAGALSGKTAQYELCSIFELIRTLEAQKEKTAHLHMTRRRSLFTFSKNDTTNVIHDFGRLMYDNLALNTSQLFMWRFCVYESVKIVKTNCSCAVFQKTGTLIFQRTKQLSCLSYRSHWELSFELKKGKTNTTRVVRFFLYEVFNTRFGRAQSFHILC